MSLLIRRLGDVMGKKKKSKAKIAREKAEARAIAKEAAQEKEAKEAEEQQKKTRIFGVVKVVAALVLLLGCGAFYRAGSMTGAEQDTYYIASIAAIIGSIVFFFLVGTWAGHIEWTDQPSHYYEDD